MKRATALSPGKPLRCSGGALWGIVLPDGTIEIKHGEEVVLIDGARAIRVWCPKCRQQHKHSL